MNDVRLGTAAFCRRVGLSAPVVRGLEAAGVINPIVTEKGWRAFSERDVADATKWKHDRAEARRKAAE